MSEQDPQDDVAPETTPADETTDQASNGRDKAIAEARRTARAAEKRAAELEAQLAARERQEAEAEGRWKEIAEKAEAEKAELEAAVQEAKLRSDIAAAATRLKFRNPELAYRLIKDDADVTDAGSAESALKRLVREDKYLVEDEPSRTGAAVTGAAQSDDPMTQAAIGLRDHIRQVTGR